MTKVLTKMILHKDTVYNLQALHSVMYVVHIHNTVQHAVPKTKVKRGHALRLGASAGCRVLISRTLAFEPVGG